MSIFVPIKLYTFVGYQLPLLRGDGCIHEENTSLLNSLSSKFVIDFDGPTRRSGQLTQTRIADSIRGYLSATGAVAVSKSISQYDLNQELQKFY